MPDFSEFKDPWEEYSARNDPFPTDNSASQLGHNQQFHYEQQHSSAPMQTYDQHQEYVPSHSGENHNQEHSVQHTEHHHWQQYSEQRRHIDQHQHNEHKHNEQRNYQEQRHHHVQHQHHEQRHYNEQQHHNEQRQCSEHHQHSEQFHQHNYHRNKTDYVQHPIQELQSVEVRHESQHASDSNQASHQNVDHLSHYHTISHNDAHAQHISSQDARDNFVSYCYRCNEKNSEQVLEAANKQTVTQRIDFLPPPPEPCTDLHNVATQSDPNVTEHLDNANVSNCSHILFFF